MAAQVLGAAAGCLGALGPKFAEESAEPFLVALRLCIFPLLEALGDFSANSSAEPTEGAAALTRRRTVELGVIPRSM